MAEKQRIPHAQRHKLTASRGVLVLLALAQALQVGHSGYVYTGWIGGIIGGLIGAGITLSVTRAASNIGAVRKRGKARFALALVGLVGLMVLNPCLIYPGAYQTFDISAEWMLVMAAIAWAVAPDLSMVLTGAITGTGMFAKEEAEKSESKAEQAARIAKEEERRQKALRAQCEALIEQYRCTVPGCGWTAKIDELMKAKNPAASVRSALAGHTKNKHQRAYKMPIAQPVIGRKVEK